MPFGIYLRPDRPAHKASGRHSHAMKPAARAVFRTPDIRLATPIAAPYTRA